MAKLVQCLVYLTILTVSVHTDDHFFYKHKRSTRSPNSRKGVVKPPQVSEECKKKGFCEDIKGYPTNIVQKILAKLDSSVTFQMDSLKDNVAPVDRLGDNTDFEVKLCDSEEKITILSQGEDKNGTWHWVINLPKKPLQGFRTDVCSASISSEDGDSSQCSAVVSIQPGYKGRCQQKYGYRLMSIVGKDGQFEQKELKLPTCCSCSVTQVDESDYN